MEQNNIFSMTRLGQLVKQNLLHNYKLIAFAAVGFCGAVSILLLIIQFISDFRPQSNRLAQTIFFILLLVTGLITAGTAFPGLRTKEKSHNFLLVPASVLEKFIMEFFGRVILFILVLPILYSVVYNIEGYIVRLFYAPYSFETQVPYLFSRIGNFPTETAARRINILVITGGLFAFITAFAGATVFDKAPFVKTLFAVAIIFFFNLFIAYFFIEILQFRQYQPTTPILFMLHMEDLLLGTIYGTIIFSLGFLAAAYFKLKEREV